jgi:hypothetical protein
MSIIDIHTNLDTYIHGNSTIYQSIIINMNYYIYLISIVSYLGTNYIYINQSDLYTIGNYLIILTWLVCFLVILS